jgi:hypothetical protein
MRVTASGGSGETAGDGAGRALIGVSVRIRGASVAVVVLLSGTSSGGVGGDVVSDVAVGGTAMIVSITVTGVGVGGICGDDRVVVSPTFVPQARSRSSLIKGDNDRLTENPPDTGPLGPIRPRVEFQGWFQG